MYYANNEQNKLIHISQTNRGLKCNCTCIACGETLVAKKGKVMEHHFSHASLKESCNIHPESLLHRYGKEVIQRHQYITLPENTSFIQQSGNVYLQLNNIQIEKSIKNIRPDITANITNNDQQQLYIELLVTHSVSDEKSAIIEGLELNTVEIDLTPLLAKNIIFPSEEAENFILNEISNKRWIYPKLPHDNPSQATMLDQPLHTSPNIPTRKEKITSKQASNTIKYSLFSKSELLKYAICVLQNNLYLNTPSHPESNRPNTSIKFINMHEEHEIFKPHLIATLHDHHNLNYPTIHIYLSENGRENPEVSRWIHNLKLNTIMIDLSDIAKKNIKYPSFQAEQIILKNLNNKKWLRLKSF